ncbi:hypothetical protein [Haloarcula montana]|uniref:hypothetical protein n=1 Tax=Haloarcula montana TaxID=3111776 RepID=UPI002D77FDB2|nr:hypothetical protein [Haloarcula sp. GH36]
MIRRRTIRLAISALIVTATFALWMRARLTAGGMGTLWEVVALAIVIAACYVVFGERIFGSALDEAQEMQEGDDGE